MPFFTVFGALSDRIGRKKIIMAGCLIALTPDASGNLVPTGEAEDPNVPVLVFLVFIQVPYDCMAYGPIAAYLVETFPAGLYYPITVAALTFIVGSLYLPPDTHRTKIWDEIRNAAAHRVAR